MKYTWLLVALGGGAGAVARHLLQQYVQGRWPLAWPVGTAVVNALGCLLAGVLVGLLERPGWGGPWRPLLLTGACGGFTTFSAVALESAGLLRAGHGGWAALYSGGSVAAGLLLAAAGYAWGRG